MDSIDIFKPLSTLLWAAPTTTPGDIEKFLKKIRECWESNPGLLNKMQECCFRTMQPPKQNVFFILDAQFFRSKMRQLFKYQHSHQADDGPLIKCNSNVVSGPNHHRSRRSCRMCEKTIFGCCKNAKTMYHTFISFYWITNIMVQFWVLRLR